ncbi:MAG: Zn-ribbon domain-containing OB-fold protein, partial [Candidatus Rokuibacteriota bacterium]
VTYLRAVDPFPLQSADHTKLAEFYACLARGRLSTTRCAGCARTAWPPRAFCPECCADRFDWVELASEGTIQAFTVQEAGLPAGFPGPRVFAIVAVDGFRIFTIILGGEAGRLTIGQRVRLKPLRVADGPAGDPRWLPAFAPA